MFRTGVLRGCRSDNRIGGGTIVVVRAAVLFPSSGFLLLRVVGDPVCAQRLVSNKSFIQPERI